MADVFNFLFDIERDGYFLPNGTRLNQLDSFDEQRKMTGCTWSEFFEKMYHEHHHVMDRSGHTPDKTFQIFYTMWKVVYLHCHFQAWRYSSFLFQLYRQVVLGSYLPIFLHLSILHSR